MERRLHQLKALDDRSRRDDAVQQLLRIRSLDKLDLEVAIGIVHTPHQLAIGENLAYSVGCSALERKRDGQREEGQDFPIHRNAREV